VVTAQRGGRPDKKNITNMGHQQPHGHIPHSFSSTSGHLAHNFSSTEQQQQQHQRLPESFWSDLEAAASWQPDHSYKWDHSSCRAVVEIYDAQLKSMVKNKDNLDEDAERLLSDLTVIQAFKALIKCSFDSPADLAEAVRRWEKSIGKLGRTPLTDHLTLRLLTANAKAGNLGRCLTLLDLRAKQGYRCREREIFFTIQAINVSTAKSASMVRMDRPTLLHFIDRRRKNIFVPDKDQPSTDNPTRWLDVILLHMHARNVPLTTAIANEMLRCYVGIGSTGKASHSFYRVARHLVTAAADDDDGGDNMDNETLPVERIYVRDKKTIAKRKALVRMQFNNPPPFFKVPSQVEGKLIFRLGTATTKKELENESAFSIPLAAAFAFADSLQQGACGHAPIVFNIHSYNALIKACVHRGAIWRAMHILDHTIPNAPSEDPTTRLQPNRISYNHVLNGLARVGDVVMAQKYYQKMLSVHGIEPDQFTVRAVVDGLLNLADAPAAITVVQDFFNQHNVIPPISTHCKILEVCLATGMVHEAKRYVYFIQQLWHWQPIPEYHSTTFIQTMTATQAHPQLQRDALCRLFSYYGERLVDADFL
jgi:pentatricopeptide repeat protein